MQIKRIDKIRRWMVSSGNREFVAHILYSTADNIRGAEPSSTVALLHRTSPAELDASNQGPVPDLEPSSEGATSATVRIDKHHSINEATPSETQLPVVLHDSAPVEREPNEKMYES
jgi:hypothetical protein